MTSKKRQAIPKIKNVPPSQAQTELAPKGITSTDELVAPTPRRDPVVCVLEDAKDYLALWDPEYAEPQTSHDLITRLSDLLRVTHDLLTDYKDERDIARTLIDELRSERYRRTAGL